MGAQIAFLGKRTKRRATSEKVLLFLGTQGRHRFIKGDLSGEEEKAEKIRKPPETTLRRLF